MSTHRGRTGEHHTSISPQLSFRIGCRLLSRHSRAGGLLLQKRGRRYAQILDSRLRGNDETFHRVTSNRKIKVLWAGVFYEIDSVSTADANTYSQVMQKNAGFQVN